MSAHDSPAAVGDLRGLLRSGMGWSAVGKFAGLGLALLVNVLAARVLSIDGAAVFFLGMSVAAGLVVLGEIGMPQTATRLVSQWSAAGRPDWATLAVRRTMAITAITASFVALCVVLPPGRWALDAAFANVGLAAVAIPIALLTFSRSSGEVVADALRGFHDIRGAVTVSGFGPGAVAVVLLLASRVAPGRPSAGTALLFVAAGWLLMAALGTRRLGGRVRSPRGQTRLPAGDFVRVGGAMFVTAATTFVLAQLDLWMAGVHLPSEEVARYGVALRTAELVPLPLFVANGVIAPIIAGMYVRGDRDDLESMIGRVSRWTTGGALTIFVVFLLFGPWLLSTFFGSPYGDAAPILAILGAGHLANVIAGPCALTLMMTSHERTLMAASLVSTVTMAVGVAVAAATLGPVGLAATAATVLAMHNIAIWALVRSRTGLRTDALAGWASRHG